MMVENTQRSDLTVYEQAQGFQMMLDMGDTVERVADRSGFSQSTIRRRIKLLELNHDNFKKAEQRGATLSDFVELNKSRIWMPGTVLETLGTANFNREMQNALSDQKYQHRKAEWIEQHRQFAVENPDANYSTHTHVAGYGYWNTSKDVEVPDDADSVAYCYKVSQNQIDLYKERDLEKENAETAKREEKRQQEQFYKDQLAALTNYMFELRRDFVTQLSTEECKKHLGEIVRFAVDAFDSNYDGELTIKLLGVAPRKRTALICLIIWKALRCSATSRKRHCSPWPIRLLTMAATDTGAGSGNPTTRAAGTAGRKTAVSTLFTLCW